MTIAPAPRGDHRPGGGARAQESAGHVDRDHLVPVRKSEFDRRAPDRDARVVDENVEAPFALERRLDHRLDASFVGCVGADRDGVKPGRAHGRGGGVGGGLVEVGKRDPRSRRRQHFRALAADPARPPGHDRDPAVQIHEITNIRHGFLLFTGHGSSAAGRPRRRKTAGARHLTLC